MYNRTLCAHVDELLQGHCGDKRESTLLSSLHIYKTYVSFLIFEQSVSRGSLKITYINLST